MEALRPLFDWLLDHTYLVVFAGTLIDASGLPFPGRLLLVAAGAYAATGQVNVLVIIGLGALAAALVDQAWYLTITRGRPWIFDRFVRRARAFVNVDDCGRWGAATILLGRFFTAVRVVGWPMACTRGLGLGRFVVLDAVAALLWAATWVLLGWVVGERWQSAAASVSTWMAVAGAAVLVLTVAVPIVLRARLRQRADGKRGARFSRMA